MKNIFYKIYRNIIKLIDGTVLYYDRKKAKRKEILYRKKVMKEYEIANTFSRCQYKQKIDDIFPKILENICLAYYYRNENNTERKKMRQVELFRYMNECSNFSIKRNNSFKSRKRVFMEVIDDNDFDNIDFLKLTVANECLNEGIDLSSDSFHKALIETSVRIYEIVNTILIREGMITIKFVYDI